MVESKQMADGLSDLKDELADAKSAVLEIIKTSPDNLQAHRVYCAYVGKQLGLEKLMAEASAMDSASLLVGVLKCVILTLIEKEEAESARLVGQYLEEIGEKVKEKWPSFKELQLTEVLPNLETSPKRLPPRSAKHRQPKKGNARKKL